MSLQQLQGIVGGSISGGRSAEVASFNALSTDTRTIQEHELFVALKGPNFNGNQFAALAAEKGASAVLVSEPVDVEVPSLCVEDTRIALGQLGAHNRLRSSARVLAITGSQGKTTVKEMTAAILSCSGEVLYTKGNLNNDYGVPLTLLRLAGWHQYAVIELGANAPGEIAYTTRLTNPDIALISNVAPTHIEGFGSLDGVASGKAEIWQGLSGGGIAILNIDDPNIHSRFVPVDDIKVVTISARGNTTADYQISSIQEYGLAGSSFTVHTPVGNANISINIPGRHNAGNALAAIALAMEAGATLANVGKGLSTLGTVKGRMNVRKGLNGSIVIDDSYNASPSSFVAAIDVLADLPGTRMVVAGDMGELGDQKESAHIALGEYAKSKGIELFYGTGTLMALAVNAFGKDGVHTTDVEQLVELIKPHLTSGTSVLVKGSRSAGMERVVKKMTEQEG